MKKTGGRDLTERAYEQAQYILENHKPAPLPEGTDRAMRAIVEEYEEELGVN
jgi:trimethylamine--corrinoid protein Co-methyltransferase